MKSAITAVAAALALIAAPGAAQTGEGEIVAKLGEYLTLWNAHDAAGVTTRVYRLPPEHRWSKAEGLQAEFDRLKADGYSHSVSHGSRGCLTAPDAGLGEMRFTRKTTDGGFMPPEHRTSVYQLKKFDDGWRIVGFGAGANNCFAAGGA